MLQKSGYNMLNLSELHKILKDNNIDTEEFSPEYLSKYYGKELDGNLVLPLIEEMVLATVDFDTPLYDVLAYANELEQKLNIQEEQTMVCDILNIVISNMPACEQNATRLLDLIEDADILDAYNLLLDDYKQYLTDEQVDTLTALAKQTFDNGVVV